MNANTVNSGASAGATHISSITGIETGSASNANRDTIAITVTVVTNNTVLLQQAR